MARKKPAKARAGKGASARPVSRKPKKTKSKKTGKTPSSAPAAANGRPKSPPPPAPKKNGAAKNGAPKNGAPKNASPKNRSPKTSPGRHLMIVGIGASAGGLEAFQQFFSRIPADSGLAFVLMPHLDATRKSALIELLQRETPMKVVEITDGMEPQGDRLHVIPPNATLTMKDGRLRVQSPRAHAMTIDPFLRSLAED